MELRQTLRDRDRARPLLAATTQTLAFTSNSDAWVDVTAFTRHLVAVAKHPHADLLTCGACTHALAQAVALYQGAFLNGFSVPDSDLFEQWVVTAREKLHQQALDVFTILSRCYQTQGDLAQALQTVRRLLELAPWQEEAHRQLMLLLALSGQRTQALAQYDRCTQILMDELGVPPAKETDALYDQILAGEIGPASRSIPLLVTPPAPAAAPPPFQVLTPPPHVDERPARSFLLQMVQLRQQPRRGKALCLLRLACLFLQFKVGLDGRSQRFHKSKYGKALIEPADLLWPSVPIRLPVWRPCGLLASRAQRAQDLQADIDDEL